MADEPPKIDGLPDSVWDNVNANPFYQFYGEDVEDSLDFSAYYKVLQDRSYIYFFIHVIDQIKYTHPRPVNEYDLKLWNLNDYDHISINFDPNFDFKDFNDGFSIGLNYGIDTVFLNKIPPSCDLKTVIKDTNNGYNVELKVPIVLFKGNIICFRLTISDNDKKFNKEGLDVFSSPENWFGQGEPYKLIR